MVTMYLNRDGDSYYGSYIQKYIKPELFNEPIIREAMRDIEGVYKIEGLAFYSEPWGVKSPESLSNGMKTLILLYSYALGEFDKLVTTACLGDNCMKYFAQLSQKYDFSISVDYPIIIKEKTPIHAMDYDSGKVFYDYISILEFYCGKEGQFNVS